MTDIDYLAFLKAIKKGSVTKVNNFIEAGADVNFFHDLSDSPSLNHSTPLSVAAKYKRIEICKILLQHGAESNSEKRGFSYISPLLQTLIDDNEYLFLYLLHNDKSIRKLDNNVFYQKNFKPNYLIEVARAGLCLPQNYIKMHLGATQPSELIEEIIKREPLVLNNLKEIVVYLKKTNVNYNIYMNLIEKHVCAENLKEVLEKSLLRNVTNYNPQRDPAVYEDLQTILNKKLLEESIQVVGSKKVFKM